MNAHHLLLLLPLILPAGAAALALVVMAFHRRRALTLALALAGLAAGIVALPATADVEPRNVGGLLVMDGFARYFIALLYAAAFLTALMAYGYLGNHMAQPPTAGRETRPSQPRAAAPQEEFYPLLLLGSVGAAALAASAHFASFFLALEVLTVSLYALIGYARGSAFGIEAAVKYLVLAGVSTALLLFGMALVYAATGTMAFDRLFLAMPADARSGLALALAGLGLMAVGIGFKLALVPFHLWAPDVYQGAPPPAAAFLGAVSKGAMVALLLRLGASIGLPAWPSLDTLFTVLAVGSMLAGALLGLLQESVKRILAYSSVSSFGYVLVGLLAMGPLGTTAASFYLAAYLAATLGAWSALAALSGPEGDADALDGLRGLAWRRPWLAGALAFMLLSLAGLPITGGFFGKLYLALAGVAGGRWLLAVVLVISSAISLFYYLRVIRALFTRADAAAAGAPGPSSSLATHLVTAAAALVVIGLGVWPEALINIIRRLVGE